MTLAKRLDARGRRWAHSAGGRHPVDARSPRFRLLVYSRWLLDQPDEALSSHPHAQAGGRRGPGSKQGSEGRSVSATRLYRVQKDVLFLYFLQKEPQHGRPSRKSRSICTGSSSSRTSGCS